VLVFSVLTLLLAWTCPSPALASAAAADPHAGMVSSPFGCSECHGSAGDIYIAAGGIDPAWRPVSDRGCVRCHVSPGGDAPKVYGGDPAHYRSADGFGHNDPSKVGCLDCHSIHGSHVESPALSGKLLRRLRYQRDALAAADLATAPHDVALSVWCTGCHAEWPAAREETRRGAGPLDLRGAAGQSHPFGPKVAGLAWRDCTTCISCHAASGGFPHYTPGADAGLVGATSATERRVGVSNRHAAGVCLACHRGGPPSRPQGVGLTY
jgi:hypothetical protein